MQLLLLGGGAGGAKSKKILRCARHANCLSQRMPCPAFAFFALLAAASAAAAQSPPLKGVGSISQRAQCSDLHDLNISWYYNWKAAPDCPVTARSCACAACLMRRVTDTSDTICRSALA